MRNQLLKYSILGLAFLATAPAYAATTSFSETFAGSFSQSGGDLNYSLIAGDGSFPTLNSTSTISPGTLNGNGTFTRTEENGDTFFGNFIFNITNISSVDSETFSTIIDYVGTLNITGGTGAYQNAIGNGTFTGTDSYFAILIEEENLELQLFKAFAAAPIDPPIGTSGQTIQWTLGTKDQVSSVPVPAALWLLGSSVLGYAGLRRKNKIQFA